MIKITRYIVALSGKGGVGKTTTMLNLGLALRQLGKESIVVDTNLITPNVALQLGLTPNTATLNRVLYKQASIFDAIHVHESGLHVVPAGLSALEYQNHFLTDFRDALLPLESRYDFVLMDCGAGLWGEVSQSAKAANEALIITNPELTAMIDSIKAIKMAEKLGVDVSGVVLNKVMGKKYELKEKVIEGMINDYPILSKIPFDKKVLKSNNLRKPVVGYKPRSKAAKAYKKLAKVLIEIGN